jgi:hypothetical protein
LKAKPTPLSEAFGTNVDRISGESMKKSTPPERSWLRTSVSAPSWLCGNTVISIRPSLCSLMRSFASCTRMFDGWVRGWLLASLRLNSAAKAGRTRTSGAASAPAAAPSISERRFSFMRSSFLVA